MEELRQKYNLKSPAVKRLMREAAELREATEQYCAQPLDENLFEWHFTVRGPPDTEFSEGRYHGRITLPPEYPMKPPSIILLTPNGRFELGKKICLSMSAHHPETWQPSWSIRTVLLALIGFMPSKGAGAIGSLDYTPAERVILAEKSAKWKCDTCLMDHSNCLKEVDPEHVKRDLDEAKELANQISFKGETEKPNNTVKTQPSNKTVLRQRVIQSAENVTEDINLETRDKQTSNTNCLDNSTNVSNNANQSSYNNLSNSNNAIVNNTGRSITESITLGLSWIVAAVLVVLILRRLAMEGSVVTKP